MKTTNGLYLHIPFCLSKCTYCDFYSVSIDTNIMNLYADALVEEICNVAKNTQNKVVDTIYIGGGTPSVFPLLCLDKVINAIYKHFNVQLNEFSIEANPATNIPFQEYKKLGINRISFGIQTLNNDLLRLIGRRHNRDVALKTIGEAQDYFDNVSCDLMLGLPTQSMEDVIDSSNILSKLVSHVSIYMLKLSSGVKMQRDIDRGTLKLPDDDLTVDFYDKAYDILKANGFERYEISNFAKKGYECKHNLKYWNREDYIGLGAAAHGFIDGYRYFNPSNITDYINGVNFGKGKVDTQIVEYNDALFEKIMLALRLREGLNVKDFDEEFHTDFEEKYSKQLFFLRNFLNKTNGFIKIKDEFLLLESAIAREFLD